MKELIASYDDLIPNLIQEGKPFTAIETLNFLDYSIQEYYQKLTDIYSKVFDNLELLKSLQSNVIGTLASKIKDGGPFNVALHKTLGMYIEEENNFYLRGR